MQDRNFRIGDLVEFNNDGFVIRGEVVDIDDQHVSIRTDRWAKWIVSIHDVYKQAEEVFYSSHSCAPYVGPIHVDSRCVHCNRELRDAEVSEYLSKKVNL
jgi:hypothetical protein